MAWAKRIRHALNTDSFVLFTQPIVHADTRIVHSYELLLRLPDDDGNLILPSVFLYAADRFGLGERVDFWVLDRALSYLKRMQGTSVGVSINVSAAVLGEPHHLPTIISKIQASEIDPSRLIFEVIESTFAQARPGADEFIAGLKAIGCRFALDDFGAAQTSFHHLKMLPLDAIKIDGEFVRDALENSFDRLFVKAMTELIHGLDMPVVAEFVRDEATAQLMLELGVDFLQGEVAGLAADAETTLPFDPS